MGNEKRGQERSMALCQLRRRLPLWLAGTLSSTLVVGIATCLLYLERGWHRGLVVLCACIALFLNSKRTACPNALMAGMPEAAALGGEQKRRIARYQTGWQLAAALPAGTLLGAIITALCF